MRPFGVLTHIESAVCLKKICAVSSTGARGLKESEVLEQRFLQYERIALSIEVA